MMCPEQKGLKKNIAMQPEPKATFQYLHQIMPIGGQYPYDFHQAQSGKKFEKYFNLIDHHRYFCSGRRAFGWILDQINLPAEKSLLMPDYGCWTALGPVLQERPVHYKCYRVDENFTPQCEEEDLKNAGAILLVNYFGLMDHTPLIARFKQINPGIQIIIDQVPALYDLKGTGVNQGVDWEFYSLRKWLPLPDGALSISKRGVIEREGDIAKEASPYVQIWCAAAQTKFDYMYRNPALGQQEAARFWEDYKRAEDLIREARGGMSALAATLLDNFLLDAFAAQRRKNYQTLLDLWPEECESIRPCFRELPEARVPQYFVIRTENEIRDKLMAFLFEQEIYPPVHWPLWEGHGAPLHASSLLSLPLDQRYGPKDMQRMIEAIKAFIYGQKG